MVSFFSFSPAFSKKGTGGGDGTSANTESLANASVYNKTGV
jgi:hypothetical protein